MGAELTFEAWRTNLLQNLLVTFNVAYIVVRQGFPESVMRVLS